MGWMTTYKPKGEPVLDFFIRQGVFTWSEDCPNTYRVLDSALVNMRTFYAAVEQVNKETGRRIVWAAIVLVRHYPKDPCYNISWKDMDEGCGSYETNCPERILKLLTPTDNEYALGWRAACWGNIEKRKARKSLPPGTVLKYGGHKYKIDPQGRPAIKNRVWVTDESGQPYTMKRSQLLAAEIVSQRAKQAPCPPTLVDRL